MQLPVKPNDSNKSQLKMFNNLLYARFEQFIFRTTAIIKLVTIKIIRKITRHREQ